MTAFIASFLQYLIIMLILIALAVAGWKLGAKLRINKDAKDAAAAAVEKTEAAEEK